MKCLAKVVCTYLAQIFVMAIAAAVVFGSDATQTLNLDDVAKFLGLALALNFVGEELVGEFVPRFDFASFLRRQVGVHLTVLAAALAVLTASFLTGSFASWQISAIVFAAGSALSLTNLAIYAVVRRFVWRKNRSV